MPKLSTNLDAQNVARMVNVPDPVQDQDVANKRVVDQAFGRHKVVMVIGDNTNTSFGINHGLNTLSLTFTVKEVASGNTVEADCQATTVNTATISFTTPPSSGQFEVTILG
jgi:hypothetical protein